MTKHYLECEENNHRIKQIKHTRDCLKIKLCQSFLRYFSVISAITVKLIFSLFIVQSFSDRDECALSKGVTKVEVIQIALAYMRK